ncbi:MAG: crossover junction endodeoxyribonuclease RuvC [Deferribacteres bacterium]|nr:crossover junction endodeoxyribonuclease RuvC [Deferribacteres bacterium]
MPINKKNNNRILAIDPGAREMGIAIMDGDELIYASVKSLRPFRPQNRLKKAVKEILAKLILEYGVTTIVAENGWVSQLKNQLFDAAFSAIKETAKQKKLPFHTHTPSSIRKIVCSNGKANKKETARKIAERYPELTIYLEQDKRWKEQYWLHMFDAVAVGLAHLVPSRNF